VIEKKKGGGIITLEKLGSDHMELWFFN